MHDVVPPLKQKKSAAAPAVADFSYSKSDHGFTLPYHGEWLSVQGSSAGLLARESTSGRLPGQVDQWRNAHCPRLQRRVRGGIMPWQSPLFPIKPWRAPRSCIRLSNRLWQNVL